MKVSIPMVLTRGFLFSQLGASITALCHAHTYYICRASYNGSCTHHDYANEISQIALSYDPIFSNNNYVSLGLSEYLFKTVIKSGLEKRVDWSSQTNRLHCQARNISFLLARCARGQASCKLS